MEYTTLQLHQYLQRINYDYDKLGIPKTSLEDLSLLMKLHLSSIPYGNLSFFYYNTNQRSISPPFINDKSISYGVSINPQDIFTKLVINKREGYCFEHAILFHKILNILGFKNYIVACRSADTNIMKKENRVEMSGMRHSANIVKIEAQKYLVDVGWDGLGQFQPIPIYENEVEDVQCDIIDLDYNQKLQVVFRYPPYNNISNNIHDKLYMAQSIINNQIIPLFFFTKEVFFYHDIVHINHYVVLDNSKPFINHIQLRMQKNNLFYKVFDNQLKIINLEDNSVQRIHLKDEQGRRLAFKNYFGIDLKDQIEYLNKDFVTFDK